MDTENQLLIDYELLSTALDYYQYRGYDRIEVPWIIHERSIEQTRQIASDYKFRVQQPNMCLIGSAEQSFIELFGYKQLADQVTGAFMAVTPCFRDEPVIDALHQTQFIKLELIWLIPPIDNSDGSLELQYRDLLISEALSFFRTEVDSNCDFDGESDIVSRTGIELGSYGLRTFPSGQQYVMGTGLALPRASLVREINGQ